LQALVGMDLIEMRPGMGSFVKSVRPEMIMNAGVMAALIDSETMVYVCHARKVLESAVAALAATEATESDLPRWRQSWSNLVRRVTQTSRSLR
jgi:DNA-binding FadR family transcriptional regulator